MSTTKAIATHVSMVVEDGVRVVVHELDHGWFLPKSAMVGVLKQKETFILNGGHMQSPSQWREHCAEEAPDLQGATSSSY